MTATAPADTRAAAYRAILDPVTFAHHILGDDLWDMPEQIMRSVAMNSLTAVKACHSSSKTWTAARLAAWWVARYQDGVVITTAPTWNQVKRLLWPEIRAAAGKRFVDLNFLQTEMQGPGDNNYAAGLSTNEGVRFQGFHGRILIIMDEATGIHPDIWTAIDGIRAGGDVRVLALGNPTIAGGRFYDAFTSPRSQWHTLTISAFDTPNLRGLTIGDLEAMDADTLNADPRPYLTRRKWVLDMYNTYGFDSPHYQSRVLGEFPLQGTDALYWLSWLLAAALPLPVTDSAELVAGVDVAGPGEDETVVAIRMGHRLIDLIPIRTDDSLPEVAAALEPYRTRLRALHVDEIGIGYHFVHRLRERGFRPTGINVGNRADNAARFDNLKAEMYWSFRERLQNGEVSGLTDDLARRQLAAVRYGSTTSGKTKVEDKPEYRKRVGSSPDRAEAIILAYMAPRSGAVAVAPVQINKTSRWNINV